MSEPELVIFDCDGVLVDSEPISNRILAAHLTEIGVLAYARRTPPGHLAREGVRVFRAMGELPALLGAATAS